MLLKKHHVSSIAALSALLFAQNIMAADTFTDALTGGKASANLQVRYEDVRNSTVPLATAQTNKATAYTARLRLGYETATFNGFGAMAEMESTKALGNKNYNSTNPAYATYANILDPEISEVNQAYLSFSGAGTTVKWGRQRIKLDNDRFIGNVGWRQNEQTYDSFTLVNKSLPSTTLTAGFITNANRVIGDGATNDAGNARMQSPIVNINYKGFSFAEIAAYYYKLDYTPLGADTTTGTLVGDASRATGSNDTWGFRLNGSTPIGGNKLLYTAEYAQQTDGSNNTTNFQTKYTLLEGGFDITNVATFKLGHEVLGVDTGATTKANGVATTQSFSTPLATLHAFNGWADMFMATPGRGLKDTYVSARTKLAGITLGADYHDYRADKSTATINNLGEERDLVATYAIGKNYVLGLKYADYKAGDAAAGYFNTKKTWLWGEFKF